MEHNDLHLSWKLGWEDRERKTKLALFFLLCGCNIWMYQPMFHLYHVPATICLYIYIYHLYSFCLSPYVRKRSLIKRRRRKVSCGKAPTSRDNLGHLSERLLYTFYTTIPLLIMVIVFVLFVLNTTQTNANKIQIKTLRRAEIIRIICQRGLGLFFTTFTVVRWWYAVIIWKRRSVSCAFATNI